MNGDTREMRAYVDGRIRQCPAYQVLADALLGLHPLVVNECECIVAEMLAAVEVDVNIDYDTAVELVSNLTLVNDAAVEDQLILLALMPPRITGPLRALMRAEEDDVRIYPVVQMLVARFVRLQLHEVQEVAQARCA